MVSLILLKRALRYPAGREGKEYVRGQIFDALDKDVKILRTARIADFAPPVAPLGHVASTTAAMGAADAGAPKPRGGYRTRRLKAGDEE